MEALLTDGLSMLDIPLSPDQQRQLEIYWSELAMWNGKYGLVNAYHICSHAHAALLVCLYCVQQVTDCLHIGFCGRL